VSRESPKTSMIHHHFSFTKRFIVDLCMFGAVLVLPWWFSVLLLAILIIYIPVYAEGLIMAFVFDTLYASHHAFPYTVLTTTTIFLLTVMFVRTRIRE
jgi:hypothetical protein